MTINICSLELFSLVQTPDLSLERKRKSASRWKTVAFYRHHTSAKSKASSLRRSVEQEISTLIANYNSGDLADVEFDFVRVTSVSPNRKNTASFSRLFPHPIPTSVEQIQGKLPLTRSERKTA
jgi:hypothetical protein